MDFELRKRKSWKDSSGVSEIIGNILILMITVILFTSIIAFVNEIPVPEQSTKADFEANITFGASGTTANLTVTLSGGSSMLSKDVLIMVSVDSVNYPYILSEDPAWTYDKWVIGTSWTRTITDTTYTSKVSVTIYDMEKDMAVWSSQVTGGTGGNPPTILQRYVDSNTLTPTADYVRETQNFSFFVKVTDPDNDLDTSTVYIDSSQIEGAGGAERYPDEISTDGWFRWDFAVWDLSGSVPDLIYNASDLDGAVITIYASDDAGHQAVSTFILTVTILPVDIDYYPFRQRTQPPTIGGMPIYLTYDSEGQAWACFGEDVENETGDTDDERYNFTIGEMVYVQVGSTVMKNVFGQNEITVIDTRTGNEYWPPSSTDDPFEVILVSGPAIIYEYGFNTSSLIPGSYTLQVRLKSTATSDAPEARFTADITIIVTSPGSPITFIPTIFLFKDSAREIQFGDKDNPFVIAGDSYKIYASVRVQDAQTTPSPTVEEVRIRDLRGGSQIYGVPPSGSMITSMTRANSTYYKFDIDLRYNNGDQWIGGRNSYTLFISAFSDTNEGVYSLSKQVFVTASFGRSDFVVGTSGVASGNGNFNLLDYLMYVENNNFFTKRTLWGYENSPSNTPDYMVTALAAGDIDSDGDKDVLMGQKTSNSLYFFENSLNTYGTWQAGSTISRPSNDTAYIIEWIAFGDINNDGDQDFVYASSDNKIVIYNNTYGMSPQVYKKFTTDVRKVELEDMTGDNRADLIVLAGGKIYVYDLKYWGQASSQIVRLPNTDTAFAGGSGIKDFDIADMNQDGRNDIVTVGDAGTAGSSDVRGVWVNNYTANSNPTQRKLDSSFAPDSRAGQVVSGGVSQTWRVDGSYLRARENLSAVGDPNDPYGWMQLNLKTNLTTIELDQILYLVAHTSGGSEVFYAWYSTDSTNGRDGMFTPMFAISGTGDTNYSFRLSTSVVNKRLFLRFTDSFNSSGDSSADNLWIDYVSIHTSTFGGFATSRYQVVTSASAYIGVRGANIDGVDDGHLETVVAKNGEWKVYDLTTAVSGWSVTGATQFYIETSAKEAEFTNVAPTLFEVVDTNGDTFEDIVMCNYTADSNYVTQVGFYLNLYPDKLWYEVKDLIEGLSDGYGRIVVLLVTNVFSST